MAPVFFAETVSQIAARPGTGDTGDAAANSKPETDFSGGQFMRALEENCRPGCLAIAEESCGSAGNCHQHKGARLQNFLQRFLRRNCRLGCGRLHLGTETRIAQHDQHDHRQQNPW